MERETLREILEEAEKEVVTAEAIAEKFGTVMQNFGPNMWVKPNDETFSEMNVTRTVDRKSLHSVILTLAKPLPLTDFLAAYPDAEEYIGDDDSPNQYGVTIDGGASPYIVRLFANTRLDSVTGYTLLRDIRL